MTADKTIGQLIQRAGSAERDLARYKQDCREYKQDNESLRRVNADMHKKLEDFRVESKGTEKILKHARDTALAQHQTTDEIQRELAAAKIAHVGQSVQDACLVTMRGLRAQLEQEKDLGNAAADELESLEAQLDEAKRERDLYLDKAQSEGGHGVYLVKELEKVRAENAQLRDQVKQLHDEQRDWEAQAERTGDELRAAIDGRDERIGELEGKLSAVKRAVHPKHRIRLMVAIEEVRKVVLDTPAEQESKGDERESTITPADIEAAIERGMAGVRDMQPALDSVFRTAPPPIRLKSAEAPPSDTGGEELPVCPKCGTRKSDTSGAWYYCECSGDLKTPTDWLRFCAESTPCVDCALDGVKTLPSVATNGLLFCSRDHEFRRETPAEWRERNKEGKDVDVVDNSGSNSPGVLRGNDTRVETTRVTPRQKALERAREISDKAHRCMLSDDWVASVAEYNWMTLDAILDALQQHIEKRE
jgi:hypothetical protein